MTKKQYYTIMFWVCFIASQVVKLDSQDWLAIISKIVIVITMIVYLVKSVRA